MNGRMFKRKKGENQWIEISTEISGSADQAPLQLQLVHHNQAPGEPIHWALYVARENEPGMVYEVTGDAECMTYAPSKEPVRVLEADTLRDVFTIANLSGADAQIVKETAEHEPPPRAASRKDVRENCQSWAVRVLARLAEKGIVEEAKVEMARSMVQPI